MLYFHSNQEVATTSVGARKFTSSIVNPRFASETSSEVGVLVLPEKLKYTTPLISDHLKLDHIQDLELADPNFMKQWKFHVMLGTAVREFIVECHVIHGRSNKLVANLTGSGWLLSGPVTGIEHTSIFWSESFYDADEEAQLNESLQAFWRSRRATSEEKECEEHFLSTHYRNSSGWYFVKLPFEIPAESQNLNSVDSYIQAERSLQRKKLRFANNFKLKEAQSAVMTKYKTLGHVLLVSESGIKRETSELFFLTHHGVREESSSTTKLRIACNHVKPRPAFLWRSSAFRSQNLTQSTWTDQSLA